VRARCGEGAWGGPAVNTDRSLFPRRQRVDRLPLDQAVAFGPRIKSASAARDPPLCMNLDTQQADAAADY
jgi:hypothetical protein